MYLVGLTMLCASTGLFANDTEKAIKTLTESFDFRQKITSYHAKAHVRYSQNGGPFSEREYLSIRDGKKQRFFFDIPLLSEEYCTAFPENGDLLAILRIGKNSKSLKAPQNPKVQIDIQRSDSLNIDLASSQLKQGSKQLLFPQFEYFGFRPGTILSQRYVDLSKIARELPAQVQVLTDSSYKELTDDKAQPRIEIRLEALHGNNPRKLTQRFLLDPAKKLFPTFIEFFSPQGKEGSLLSTISTTPALHEKSGIWYPAQWVYERKENGKLTKREEVTVELLTLNEPIDPALFTLQGMERLKPDTRVNWIASSPAPPAKGPLLWNGKEIVAGQPGRGLSADFSQQPSRWPKLLVLNIVILASIFAIHFYRRYNRHV